MRTEIPTNNDLRPKEVVYLNIEAGLEVLPEPGNCSHCGSGMQREFLEYETTTSISVLKAPRVPGYGCTGCELKEFDPGVTKAMLTSAAGQLRERGDLAGADRLDAEARLLEVKPITP